MASSSTKTEFWAGFRVAAPLGIVVGPFGALFGVLATEAGLNVFEVMSFSIVVIAGAAQITALQLMTEHAPTVVVILTALAINLRMAMYSAALTPHFGSAPFATRLVLAYFTVDQSFALSSDRFERSPSLSLPQKLAYFFGTVIPVCPLWFIGTFLGAWLGASIPGWLPLDFAVPITFIAMIAPMLRTRAHVYAAVSAVIASILFGWLPYSLGAIVGGAVGVCVGAETERRLGEVTP